MVSGKGSLAGPGAAKAGASGSAQKGAATAGAANADPSAAAGAGAKPGEVGSGLTTEADVFMASLANVEALQ